MLKRPKDPTQYPAYLRKIGEHAIAEHMEGMVEPVRCKDCRSWEPEPMGDVEMCYAFGAYTGSDDFCSNGKKRQDDGK